MSKAKKIIAASLVLVLIAVLFTACGKKEKYKPVNDPKPNESVSDSESSSSLLAEEPASVASDDRENITNSTSNSGSVTASQKPVQKPSSNVSASNSQTNANKPDNTSAASTAANTSAASSTSTTTETKPESTSSTKPSQTGGIGIGNTDPNMGGAWW